MSIVKYVKTPYNRQRVRNSVERGFNCMLSNIGIPSLLLILVIALVIFGPKKLPEIGKAMGQTLKEFKNSTKELTKEDDETNHDRKND